MFFRLPDFRWFPNFPRFRDSEQGPSGLVYPQYPGSALIPDQSRRSQRQSGQYPVYPNSSGYVNPGPWNGYTPYPSQANRPVYPSQPQGQYRPQQRQQVQNQHLPPTRPQPQSNPQSQPPNPPQTQMSQVAQPYFYPNDDSNPHPHYCHRRHPQERPQDNPNNRSSNSQLHLTPRSVQSSAHQAWTPLSRVPSHHPTPNPQTPRSLNGHWIQGTSTPRAARQQAHPNAPHLQSRMLKIPLIHPLVCGHRHSLIPDQIPETEVGKPERSVWDSQSFILPRGSRAPMMIDAVQVRSFRLDWDITLPPSFSKEIGRDGQVFNSPRHLHLPLIQAKFRSEVCIKTRQNNPLTKCFLRWGCIVVEPRDPNGMSPTMKQFLHDIWEYFHTSLTEEECRSLTPGDLARLHQIVESRAEDYAREGEQSPVIRARGPTRRDMLCGYTRFAGLEVCPRFAATGDLFLYLEPV